MLKPQARLRQTQQLGLSCCSASTPTSRRMGLRWTDAEQNNYSFYISAVKAWQYRGTNVQFVTCWLRWQQLMGNDHRQTGRGGVAMWCRHGVTVRSSPWSSANLP